MLPTPDLMNLMAREVLGRNEESRDIANVSGARILRVPVTRNLNRVFVSKNGIEDRLFGEARRKHLVANRSDQFELSPADRSE